MFPVESCGVSQQQQLKAICRRVKVSHVTCLHSFNQPPENMPHSVGTFFVNMLGCAHKIRGFFRPNELHPLPATSPCKKYIKITVKGY